MTYTNFALFLGWMLTHKLAFAALIIWVIVWKGLALWRAGRNNQPAWFIALLLINTAGILEILYVFFFERNRN